MIAISNSEMAKWQRCPRQWLVTYYLGFRPAAEPVTGNRQLGTRIHAALEAHYGHQLDGLAVLGLLYQIEISEHPEYERELKAELDLAMIMLSGQLEWASETGEDSRYQVIAAEADVRTELPGLPGVMLRAKLDLAVRDADTGALMFKDWKTSASFDRHEILALDPQFRFYCLVQQLMVRDGQNPPLVAGGRVVTLRRCKRTGASKPPYYQADSFSYSPQVIEAAYRRALGTCRKIMAARAALDRIYAQGGSLEVLNRFQREELAPVVLGHDCSWSCPLAAGLCTAMDDGSDWAGMLSGSGQWVQGDPYAYYQDDPIRSVRARLAELSPTGATVGTASQGDDDEQTRS